MLADEEAHSACQVLGRVRGGFYLSPGTQFRDCLLDVLEISDEVFFLGTVVQFLLKIRFRKHLEKKQIEEILRPAGTYTHRSDSKILQGQGLAMGRRFLPVSVGVWACSRHRGVDECAEKRAVVPEDGETVGEGDASLGRPGRWETIRGPFQEALAFAERRAKYWKENQRDVMILEYHNLMI